MAARFGWRTAAGGDCQHPQNPDLPMKRQGDDAPGFDFVARLGCAPPVDPNVPGFDHRLGQGSALRQPDEEQKPVDPQVSAAA